MDERGHYTRDEVLQVLTGPMVETDLPGGGVMIVKGGVVGLGWSRDEATSDWWQHFLETIARPEPPFTGGETEIDTPLDSPTGEHPCVS